MCTDKQYLLYVKEYFICLVDILILAVFQSKWVKISYLSNNLFLIFKSALQNLDAFTVAVHKMTLQLKSVSLKGLTF